MPFDSEFAAATVRVNADLAKREAHQNINGDWQAPHSEEGDALWRKSECRANECQCGER